jgi:hypothetical protein
MVKQLEVEWIALSSSSTACLLLTQSGMASACRLPKPRRYGRRFFLIRDFRPSWASAMAAWRHQWLRLRHGQKER